MKIKLGKRKRRPKSKWKKLQDSKLKPTTCIITLSIKELSAPVKCQKLSNQIKKSKTQLYAICKRCILNIRHRSVESKKMKVESVIKVVSLF